jgi:hypothetical protein
MPYLNAAAYREREKRWREAAKSAPDGVERDACLSLADGYANLISVIERVEQGRKVHAGEDDL